jgi:hypothetical protein
VKLSSRDLDEKEPGDRNFVSLHPEDWWTGSRTNRTLLRQFGTLVLKANPPKAK